MEKNAENKSKRKVILDDEESDEEQSAVGNDKSDGNQDRAAALSEGEKDTAEDDDTESKKEHNDQIGKRHAKKEGKNVKKTSSKSDQKRTQNSKEVNGKKKKKNVVGNSDEEEEDSEDEAAVEMEESDKEEAKEEEGAEEEGKDSGSFIVGSLEEADEDKAFDEEAEKQREKAKRERGSRDLRVTKALPEDRDASGTFAYGKVPQSLHFQPREFTEDFEADDELLMSIEGRKETKAFTATSHIRWRKVVDPKTGEEQMESNARIVEWSDGSRHLYIGNEPFRIREEDVTYYCNFLFASSSEERHRDLDGLEGVARIEKKFTFLPSGITANMHLQLSAAMEAGGKDKKMHRVHTKLEAEDTYVKKKLKEEKDLLKAKSRTAASSYYRSTTRSSASKGRGPSGRDLEGTDVFSVSAVKTRGSYQEGDEEIEEEDTADRLLKQKSGNVSAVRRYSGRSGRAARAQRRQTVDEEDEDEDEDFEGDESEDDEGDTDEDRPRSKRRGADRQAKSTDESEKSAAVIDDISSESDSDEDGPQKTKGRRGTTAVSKPPVRQAAKEKLKRDKFEDEDEESENEEMRGEASSTSEKRTREDDNDDVSSGDEGAGPAPKKRR